MKNVKPDHQATFMGSGFEGSIWNDCEEIKPLLTVPMPSQQQEQPAQSMFDSQYINTLNNEFDTNKTPKTARSQSPKNEAEQFNEQVLPVKSGPKVSYKA